MVLIGSTGSGTTFLSNYVAGQFNGFTICKSVTTRNRRTAEAAEAAYNFVNEMTFTDLLTSGRLAYVKFSDFDDTKYGIEETELASIVQHGRSPILTCHSIEEAQTLKHFLQARKMASVCISVYASEQDRKHALARSGETMKHLVRYHMDVAFKIQAHQKQFADCNYIVVNRYDSQATEQMRAIVNAIQSNDIADGCDVDVIRESMDADIQEIRRGLSLTASEL